MRSRPRRSSRSARGTKQWRSTTPGRRLRSRRRRLRPWARGTRQWPSTTPVRRLRSRRRRPGLWARGTRQWRSTISRRSSSRLGGRRLSSAGPTPASEHSPRSGPLLFSASVHSGSARTASGRRARPCRCRRGAHAGGRVPHRPPGRSMQLHAGVIQAIHLDGLVAWARQHQSHLVLTHAVGDLVATGEALVTVC